MAGTVTQVLDISADGARRQWLGVMERTTPPPGVRQVPFTPVETLLCLAGMLLVDGGRFGSASAHRAPSPVPELARLFCRPPTSITSKMANLEGSRPRGASTDHAVWLALHGDTERLAAVYRTVLAGARSAGIGRDLLPDFLGVEGGGHVALLGQDEVQESIVEQLLREALEAAGNDWRPTERETVVRARIGQHRFAHGVLDNCGWECVFCGFALTEERDGRLLRASHIKPWRDSEGRERTDPTNGVAACPTHDAAFDGGLLTLDASGTVELASSLRRAAESNAAVRSWFGPPTMRDRVPVAALDRPLGAGYLSWHRERIYVA